MTRHSHSLPVLASCVVGCLASGAAAQMMTLRCTADPWVVTPDQPSTVVTITAAMHPDEVGFADLRLDLWNAQNLETGWYVSACGPDHLVNLGGSCGTIQADNAIHDIRLAQLPPFLNQQFDASDPIVVYRFEWQTDDFTSREMEYEVIDAVGSMFTDEFGTAVAATVQSVACTWKVACPADYNGDGTLDVFDILDFLGELEDGDPDADWNGDTVFDIFDVVEYLASFETGC